MTGMSSREAAWHALHDPATDAATLAAIAQAHPEFADAVARHPNTYPELREWALRAAAAPAAATAATPAAAAAAITGTKADPDAASRGAGSRRRILIGGAVLGGLLLLGGGVGIAVAVSSASGPASEPQTVGTPTPTPTHKAQVAPTPSATPTPSRPLSLAPGEGYLVMGDLLVDGDAQGSDVADRVQGPVRVFTPETGELLVDAAQLLGADEVTGQTWTLAGLDDASYLVGLVEVREPASGLDPEQWVTSLVSVGVREHTGRVVARVPVVTASCEDAAWGWTLAGSGGDAVAAGVSLRDDVRCESDEKYTAAWSTTTGEVIWRVDGVSPAGSALGTILSWDDDPLDASCERVIGRAVVDGRELFRYSGAEHRVEKRCTVSIPDADLSAVFESQAQKGRIWTVDVDFDDDDAQSVSYDARTGEQLQVRQPVVAYDPATGMALAVGWDPTRSERRGLEVYDTRSGATAFTMDEERYQDLNVRPLSLVEGMLYLETSDQTLAIDVETGAVVDDAVVVHPLAVMGDYVYLSDGGLRAR
ncbi:hypothetical protein AB1K54_08115 [Microbacterium sp. BWT-B31]|uniref:variant leucine-rich repeat-containing protein n=1 Tax=Microbacterium sp. BWT-B31 TaxID=3232072 RepID=UPI0035271267